MVLLFYIRGVSSLVSFWWFLLSCAVFLFLLTVMKKSNAAKNFIDVKSDLLTIHRNIIIRRLSIELRNAMNYNINIMIFNEVLQTAQLNTRK